MEYGQIQVLDFVVQAANAWYLVGVVHANEASQNHSKIRHIQIKVLHVQKVCSSLFQRKRHCVSSDSDAPAKCIRSIMQYVLSWRSLTLYKNHSQAQEQEGKLCNMTSAAKKSKFRATREVFVGLGGAAVSPVAEALA